jgi:hypothetical protein
MESNINYEIILQKSADDLFENYSVEELGKIIAKLGDDVTTKRQRLKFLVGKKYRDLLNVADDIIKMNNITFSENECLMNLAFKKSDYNSKSLNNLSKFNKSLHHLEIEKVQDENRQTILHNVVHDLNYSLITLKHMVNPENNLADVSNTSVSTLHSGQNQTSITLDETIDNYQPVSSSFSNGFVLIAKHIFLVDYFFKDEVSKRTKSFAVIKYNQLCQEFNEFIEFYISGLKHESDSEFILDLSLSYLISNKLNPSDALKWLLLKRLNHVERLVKTEIKFLDVLNYIFMSLAFVNLLKSRMSISLTKLKNKSGNLSWIQQTSFSKWIKWLKEIAHSDLVNDSQNLYEFELDSYEINRSELDKFLSHWKSDVANELLISFNNRFNKTLGNSTDLVILLKYVLLSFKHFTSLTDLPIKDENIVNHIITEWSKSFSSQLKNQLGKFVDIKDLVLETFDNENSIISMVTSSKETILNEFKENLSVDSLLKASNAKDDFDPVFNLSNIFRHDLKSIINSIELLKSLSSAVLKPVISIDDDENEEFWLKISGTLSNILELSVQNSLLLLNNSINDFFSLISELLGKQSNEVSNTRIFYLIRILAELENTIQLNDIFETFSKYSKTALEKKINLEALTEPLLNNCFQIITESIYTSEISLQLEDLLTDRFIEDKEYPETLLWETLTNERKIPTLCSISYSSLLLKYCDKLINCNGINYSLQFTLPSFQMARKDTIMKLLENISLSLDKIEIPVNETKILLTYSDYIFTLCLLNDETFKTDDFIDQKFVKLYNAFEDPEYTKKIQTAVFENYKSQSLIFYPLFN